MKNETSYGVIPLKLTNGQWEVLLIQHQAGHWSFPKGHTEIGETPLQTAARELEEETGLKIKRLIPAAPLEETYDFQHRGLHIHKTVVYFLAEVEGKLSLQIEEIAASKWVALEKAYQYVSFQQAQNICAKSLEIIRTLKI